MENWGASLYALDQGVLPTFVSGKTAMVATHDIGTTAAKALLEGGRGKRFIELAGPKDYTPSEVAEALAKVTGKPIALQVGPIDAMKDALVGAGVNAHWAGLYQEMTRNLNSGHIAWEVTGEIVR